MAMRNLVIYELLLYLLAIISIKASRTALDNSGGCVYSFEVGTNRLDINALLTWKSIIGRLESCQKNPRGKDLVEHRF